MMKMRTLSGQVYFYFAIVIVISLASVGFVSYFQASRALDTQVEQYMEQMIENVAYQTDIYLQTYELLSNTFSSNTDVRNFSRSGRMIPTNIIIIRTKLKISPPGPCSRFKRFTNN